MKLNIKAKNFKITDKLNDLIEKKVMKLEKYFDQEAVADVLCKEDNGVQKFELNITGSNYRYRSEVAGLNMYENLDLALPKIERQIIKSNDKKRTLSRQNSAEIGDLLFLDKMPKKEKQDIVKKKIFDLEPLSVEDAKYMMESIGHDFYIFLNNRSGLVNILYKRKDNQYGLIEANY